jgi:hypothetical protein
MILIARIVVGIVGLAAAFLFVRTIVNAPRELIAYLIQVFLGTGALLSFWFAALGHLPSERAMLVRTLLIGAIVGAVAFAAGFFGPMIFAPRSNQGPLLGIFITGPAGFVLGCLGGFVWTRFAGRAVRNREG